MINLTINGEKVSVAEGSSVLQAAEKQGIALPTLCYFEGSSAFASCMVCMVKNLDTGKLIPACSSLVLEGMKVETDSEEIQSARKAALELLLSEHIGDCEAICRVACPAYVNVPEMIRKIKSGDITAAVKVFQAGVALPRVIGRICHAPCQKACKRGRHDEAVSIRQLEKYVSDADFAKGKTLKAEKTTDKKVAIIGSGPTGLSAAFHLLLLGHQCVVFDKNDNLGGGLRSSVPEKELPRKVLDDEIEVIGKLGCEFRTKTEVAISAKKTGQVSFNSICDEHDAVVVASGADLAWQAEVLETTDNGLKVGYATFLTSRAGVFAGGDALMPLKQIVRSVADGRSISQSIDSFLKHGKPAISAKIFDSRSGKNSKDIIAAKVANVNSDKAVLPAKAVDVFSAEEALREAERCLNCDCAKATTCKLRDLATEYSAQQNRYKAAKSENDPACYAKSVAEKVVFEPGKCIKCGICVRISQKYPNEAGMTYIGRGITTRIAVPFDDPLGEGVKNSAGECIEACPTGALSWKHV